MSKICNKCGIEYPATNEFFHNDRNCLRTECKFCRRIYKQKYREINKEKISAENHQYYLKNKEHIDKKSKDNYKQSSIKAEMSITGLHNKIRKFKPQPKYCIICNLPKKLDICSINHTYTRDPNDYIWLCRSCHIIFDIQNKKKEVIKYG